MTPPIAVRLLLDAQDEFLGAIDHIPAPGRGGPLGRLNSSGWVIAHLAASHDLWINVLVGGSQPDAWAADWLARQREATLDHPLATPYAEAREAYIAIAARAVDVFGTFGGEDLRVEVPTRFGPEPRGYLVARASAHLFAHAGELAVIGALVTAPDLGLPGTLARTTEAGVDPAAEADSDADLPPLIVRLLLDARHEFARVVDALPQPAAFGAVPRVHAGALTIAEVANHVAAWGKEQGIGTATAITSRAGQPPPSFDEARAAYLAAIEGTAAALEGLRAADLARPSGKAGTVGGEAACSVALLFSRAGALNALGSLFGAPDLGLPGALARVAAR